MTEEKTESESLAAEVADFLETLSTDTKEEMEENETLEPLNFS